MGEIPDIMDSHLHSHRIVGRQVSSRVRAVHGFSEVQAVVNSDRHPSVLHDVSHSRRHTIQRHQKSGNNAGVTQVRQTLVKENMNTLVRAIAAALLTIQQNSSRLGTNSSATMKTTKSSENASEPLKEISQDRAGFVCSGRGGICT
jgi:hypothetical protein